MTTKQQRFCDEYLIDLNATQAAIRAGYSKKTAKQIASELLSKPDLRAYIDQRLEEIKSEKVADQQEIMEFLTAVVRGETSDQALKLCGDGCQTVVNMKVASRDKLKAAELIGKRYGMFVDKTDLNLTQPIIISGGDQLEE